tara:strand:+ start:235 stop:423 length:189 start_codon:yes stop_codon:yes gene_type:complete
MKKWVVLSGVLTTLIFLEDVGLFVLGRYTNVSEWIVILGIAIMGLGFGGIARIRKVKKFLGD